MFQQPFLPPPLFDPERIIRREMEGEFNQPDLQPQAEAASREEGPTPAWLRWLRGTFRGDLLPHR